MSHQLQERKAYLKTLIEKQKSLENSIREINDQITTIVQEQSAIVDSIFELERSE